jgi:hypothetical protein
LPYKENEDTPSWIMPKIRSNKMSKIVAITKIILAAIVTEIIVLLLGGTITGHLDFAWTIGMLVGMVVGAALGAFERVVTRWIRAASETVATTLVRMFVGVFVGGVIGSLVGFVMMILKTPVGLPRIIMVGLLGGILGLVFWTAIKVAMTDIASARRSFVWSSRVVIGMLFGAIVGWIGGVVLGQIDKAGTISGTVIGAIVGMALGAIIGADARKAWSNSAAG